MAENANHSKKISFSHDFPELDFIPVEKSSSLSSSSNDPCFSFDLPLPIEAMSAGEIFSDGKLLPTRIKKLPDPRDLKPRKLPVQRIPGLSKSELNQIRGFEEIEEIGEVELMATTGVLDCDVGLPLLSHQASSSNCIFEKQPLKKKSYGGYRYKGNGGGIKVYSLLDMIPSGSLFGLGLIMVGSGSNNNTENKKRTMVFTW